MKILASTGQKKVSFEANHIAFTDHSERTKEEIRSSWYSREDLMESCSEAKRIVSIINSVNGDMDAIDHNEVCVVGLEKFHGKKERDTYRKLLIKSVLIRQEMNRGLGLMPNGECLCQISEMISVSFKEFALWQAAMHKFHADHTPSLSSSRPLTCVPENSLVGQGGPKRQRCVHGFQTIAPNATQKPLAYRTQNTAEENSEIRQIMSQYCSR